MWKFIKNLFNDNQINNPSVDDIISTKTKVALLQHYAKHFIKKQFQIGDVVKLNPELDSNPWVSTENENLLVVVESTGIEQCTPNTVSGTHSAGFIYDFRAYVS